MGVSPDASGECVLLEVCVLTVSRVSDWMLAFKRVCLAACLRF